MYTKYGHHSKESKKGLKRSRKKIGKFKRSYIGILSFVMTFFMVMTGYTPVHAEQNENYDYTYTNVETWGGKININGVEEYTALFNIKNPDGSTSNAYCIDLFTEIKDGHKYSRANIEDSEYFSEDSAKHIRAIIRNSYPFISLEEMAATFGITELTDIEAITATQASIWHYANDAINPSGLSENAQSLYEQLVALPPAEGQVAIASILANEPTIVDSEINSENCDFDFSFKANGNNYDGSKIELTYNLEGQSTDSAVTNEGIDENGYTHIKVTNVPRSANLNFTVSAVQNVGSDVYFYAPEGGREASQSLIGMQSGNTNISKTFNYNMKFGKVTVKKVDDDNNDIALKGAEFTIKNTDGNIVRVITTGEDGIANAKLLPGSYIIEETKAPSGYLIINESKEFTITEDESSDIEFTFTNKKDVSYIKGSIEITKTDTNGNPLKGAEFVIKDESGKEISRDKTDENGIIKFIELPYGKYTYQEVTAPEGYVLDNKEYDFTIKNDKEVIKVTMKNEKKSSGTTNNTNTTNKPLGSKPSIPNTGDVGFAGVIALLALAGGGLLLNNKKKKSEK